MNRAEYYRKRRKDAIVSALIMFYCAIFGVLIVVVAQIVNLITKKGA